ncbi:PAS domain-containing protein [Flavobacterium succinicans]|uniref:Blue-light-activated protein n=1 Tax=Flavobacterium succinicans TaxID=29536 RepID=A0A199XR44_9FLAO|nr:PAS domain-containing protein [Flavobacterium succinicans]OAZ03716.1 blue-light-activated protein [Flavobacterium succinicans]
MVNISDYENAKAKYFNTLALKTTTILSMSFHEEFLGNVKKSFSDFNRLHTILPQNTSELNNENLRNSLLDEVVVVTDVNLKIVFASNNLTKMNGYTEKEVLGNSPKMFHGAKTNQLISRQIREKIDQKLPFESKVINYKKNGKTYDCLIRSYPVFNKKGVHTHFIAFEQSL